MSAFRNVSHDAVAFLTVAWLAVASVAMARFYARMDREARR